MYTLMAMIKSCSIAEARNGLTEIVHEVEQGATVHITRRGRPAAVLLSEASYAKLVEARPTFTQAFTAWRRAHGNGLRSELGVVRSHFDSVRDRNEGRRVKL
jgi:prevent-host-death family protein